MHILNSSTLLLSLVASTAVSAFGSQGSYYPSNALSSRDIYDTSDDFSSLFARDAEPEADEDHFDIIARDAYLDGYMAGLAKREAELDLDALLYARGNSGSKQKDDRPDWQKEMDNWENDKDRKKKQKDLDKYLAEQQKKNDKKEKKEKKKQKDKRDLEEFLELYY